MKSYRKTGQPYPGNFEEVPPNYIKNGVIWGHFIHNSRRNLGKLCRSGQNVLTAHETAVGGDGRRLLYRWVQLMPRSVVLAVTSESVADQAVCRTVADTPLSPVDGGRWRCSAPGMRRVTPPPDIVRRMYDSDFSSARQKHARSLVVVKCEWSAMNWVTFRVRSF